MKKLFGILVFLMLLLAAVALAQGPKAEQNEGAGQKNIAEQDSGDDIDDDLDENELEDASDASEGKGKGETERERLKQKLEVKKQELAQQAEQLQEKAKQAFKNQNGMKLAVHALLEMENMTKGIGQQVSALAREFNNGIEKTLQAEEKIQARSKLKRFFAGGDEKTAAELEAEVTKNRERIQELKRLRDECDCDAEIKQMLQEQIQIMEQEQDRLGNLAEKEKKSKGIFGWLWK